MDKKTPESKDLVIVQNGLTQLEATENLVQLAKEDIIVTTIGSLEELEQKKEQYKGLVLANLDDMSAYNTVAEGIKILKGFSTDLEKARTARTAPAVKYQKDLKAEVDAIKEGIAPIITHLESQKRKFDDAAKAKLDKLFNDRCAELTKRAYQLVGGLFVCGVIQVPAENLRTLKDEDFQFYLIEGDKELARLEAEAKRKEEEAKRQREEQERLAAEAKRLADEKAQFERDKAEFEEKKAKESAEIAAQGEALEKAYDVAIPPVDAPVVVPPVDATVVVPVVNPVGNPVTVGVVDAINSAKQKQAPNSEYVAGAINAVNKMRADFIYFVDSSPKLTREILKEWATRYNYQ